MHLSGNGDYMEDDDGSVIFDSRHTRNKNNRAMPPTEADFLFHDVTHGNRSIESALAACPESEKAKLLRLLQY